MKFILTSVILWIVFSPGNGQKLATSHIGGAGTFLTSTQGSIHYHVGEVSILQHTQLREGVIQFFGVTTLVHTPRIELEVKIYPNPTARVLHLVSTEHLVKKWAITDIKGAVLKHVDREQHKTSIDLSRLGNGAYYVVALGHYGPIQAFPFQVYK